MIAPLSPTQPFYSDYAAWMVLALASGGMRPPVAPIERGAALRANYRMQDGPLATTPGLVARHPDNRSGIAINRTRTDELVRHALGHYGDEQAFIAHSR